MIKGQVIAGELGKILVRKKSEKDLEIGELLIADTPNAKTLLQVCSLFYGSQISQQNLELISGLKLEEDNDLEFLDPKLRNYTLAYLKPMITINEDNSKLCKTLPPFFSSVREITNDDLKFLTKPQNPLFIGKLRSGSKILDVDVSLPGDKIFVHHILIPGTTGRGKSVLLKVMLWNIIDKDYCGILVLDPHDEYYGRNELGLKDNAKKDNIVYYTTKNPPPGCKTLKINLKTIKPQHFNGVVDFSDPQKQALNMYYKEFGSKWIESIILERKLENAVFRDDTLAVIKRRLLYLLDLEFSQNKLSCKGAFDLQAGETTINDICNELEQSKTVIIDTSNFAGAVELLIGSLISTEILNRYKYYRINGELQKKPVISIVLEEAPRVLGKEILEKGSNIFATIAREGRKFRVGLTAITQLPSLIPRQILANMNTKIILGIEMKPERQAIIESASQDLSEDDRNIASLDKGEAIISSNFTKFATPIKIPLFEDLVKKKKEQYKKDFPGINTN
ncbi:ATP-binding protein [Candidatus Woesearchaeota archaeon]|nr:ATP-binding protein [Candidatus Woesearchaeota archaeon]